MNDFEMIKKLLNDIYNDVKTSNESEESADTTEFPDVTISDEKCIEIVRTLAKLASEADCLAIKCDNLRKSIFEAGIRISKVLDGPEND